MKLDRTGATPKTKKRLYAIQIIRTMLLECTEKCEQIEQTTHSGELELPVFRDWIIFDTILTVSRQLLVGKVKRTKPLLISLTRERTELLSPIASAFAVDKEVSFKRLPAKWTAHTIT